MKKFFVVGYLVLLVALIVATPFDISVAHLIYGGETLLFKVISDLVYVPAFFVGYLGIFYYFRRFRTVFSHWFLTTGLYIGTLLGLVVMSYMFIHTMRFFPNDLYFSPVFTVILIVVSWKFSSYILGNKMYQFDYLCSVALGMIVSLFFMVMSLKRVFGRARVYVVFENEQLYSNWYEIRGMATTRAFYSIPSGHTTFVAVAFWFILVAIVVPQFKRYVKQVVITVIIWIAIHGYIRLLFAEHFLTDVLFSLLMGLAVMQLLLFSSMKISGYINKKFELN